MAKKGHFANHSWNAFLGRDGYTVGDSSVTHFSCDFIFCEEVWHFHLEYYQTWS